MPAPISATLDVQITHRSGPVIDNPDHVVAWTCADGTLLDGGYCGFTFEVCPTCPLPEDCGCDGTVAIYHAAVVSAGLSD